MPCLPTCLPCSHPRFPSPDHAPGPPSKRPTPTGRPPATADALIYPGLGLGAMLSKARTLTDTMIIAGTRRLASLAPALQDPDDALLTDFEDAPRVNFEVAVAVVEPALAEGSAGVEWKREEVRERVGAALWKPVYGTYVFDSEGGEA